MMTTTTLATATALFIATDTDRSNAATLLKTIGFNPVEVSNVDAVTACRDSVTLCLVDLRANGEALKVVRAVRAQHPRAVIVGVADPARPSAATDAIRAGVFDVLPRPATARDLEALLANAREQASLAANMPALHPGEPVPWGIVGTSPAMRLVMELVQRAAAGRCGILISGERGTGREMIARAVHAHSSSPAAPFVKVDCSGPTPEDVELELFGVINRRVPNESAEYRTLEQIQRNGRLYEAGDGGTLFLENLTEMPARVQQRLVRILRDREVFLEDEEAITLDIRPIASVDRSVDGALEDGRLRQDLFERLSLIRIDVPALRQRREDIPVLATHFLKEICRANGQPLKTLTRPALTLLSALPWRANAPELRGLLERLVLLVPQGLIRLEDVIAHTQFEGAISPTGFDATLRQARAQFERDYIASVLQHPRGRHADAAKVLGIQRTNLYRKMRRLSLLRTKSIGREA
ncbi:MAG: sigma 54-interacting transcriptional regulator [Acidobacteriaceae bacterium]|jgi:DNA-binding NtrC family response regulator|nr:sigma 54-interacting transcriptional regulator [Acidobacteriaceae bacterium]